MASSDVQICNIALGRIGEKQTVGALDEANAVARACNDCYPVARDFMLSAHPWKWATKHATLALLDYTRSGWTYAYATPTGMVTALSIFSGIRPGRSVSPSVFMASSLQVAETGEEYALLSKPVPFETELSDDDDALIILTDMEDAELLYVSSATAPGLFPSLFTEALSWKLAGELALRLPNRRDAFKECMAAFAISKLEAIASDLRQAKEDPEPPSRFISARRGGS